MLWTQGDFLRSALNVRVVRDSNKRGQTAVMFRYTTEVANYVSSCSSLVASLAPCAASSG